ncbi:RNA-directed DNA polymerase, eukaryota [Tanacetum coccineum]
MIHNSGTKHKVWLEKVSGSNNYALFSREWKAFITDSRYVWVNTLHFIRAAPDEYYVSGYHNDGSECNRYDLDRVGFRQRIFLLTVANLEESPIIPALFFSKPCNQPSAGYGQGWHILVYVERIKVGSRLVFTNLLNNSISMIPFADSVLGLRFERVPRMPLNGIAPFVVSPIDNDPRMRHERVWDNHEEFHNDEKDCFYSPLVAYVTDRSRLTIPGWFVDDHEMQGFHNAYLVYDEESFYVDLDWVVIQVIMNHGNGSEPWALLAKWVWRFLSHDNSLWYRVISGIHGSNAQLSAAHSSLWKSIINSTNSLKEQGFPRLFALESFKDISVAEKLNGSLLSSFRRGVCDLNGEGVFCVKDIRFLIEESFLPNSGTPTRWVKSVPIKINVFAWKVCLDRLSTRSNLSRRNIAVVSTLCPFCDASPEDTSHLLFACPLAKDVMSLVCRWWNLSCCSPISYDEWLSWFKSIRLGSKLKDLLEGVFLCFLVVLVEFQESTSLHK